MTETVLRAERVSRVFATGAGDVHALTDVSLGADRGELVVVRGPSGSGKTTLLNLLGALDRPTSGRVLLGDGRELSGLLEKDVLEVRRSQIGYVFQSFGLISVLSAAENVEVPLRLLEVDPRERDRRVAAALDLVGLSGHARQRPYELSGGQQQRVGIARALATEPSVLLCDEPTSALDSQTTGQILGLIRDVRDRLGITVLIITHEMSVVREVCDSVTLLDHGRVAQSGPISEVVADHGSRLARALIPLPGHETDARSVIEVSFGAEVPAARVLATVAAVPRVEVRAGTIETLVGEQAGRLQLTVPLAGRDDALAALIAAGIHAEVAT